MTQELLKELFEYKDGNLYWKLKKQGVKLWQIAGCVDITNGYRTVRINRKGYLAHRIIWLYNYGVFPTNQIDHINGIKDDNRINNLREANSSQNKANSPKQQNCSSIFKGVSWNKSNKKWTARIRISGNKKHLGNFYEESAAAQAYNEAAIKEFGEFALINKI